SGLFPWLLRLGLGCRSFVSFCCIARCAQLLRVSLDLSSSTGAQHCVARLKNEVFLDSMQWHIF
ncbi:MAG: hypothetical protein WCH01_20835, partial [Methylococcaceae bacterium]